VVVDTGQFDTVRNSLASLSNDRRVQVVLIAFVFGALLEATAGFGTPVAITAALMAGLGFEAVYAAALALLANTAPVAFGGFGIPILTGAQVAQLDVLSLSQMVGRQTPILALIIPGFLVVVMSGWRRMLEVWPIVVVSGVAFAGTQFVVSNVAALGGPTLADLLAAIVAVIAVVALLAFWRPREEWHFPNEPPAEERESYERPPLGRTAYAWSPFIVLVVVLLISQLPGINDGLKYVEEQVNFSNAAENPQGTVAVPWPGLHEKVTRQPPAVAEAGPYPAQFQTNWLTAAGSLILIADIIALVVLAALGPARVGPGLEDLRPDAEPAQVGNIDDSRHPGAGLPAELLGHDLYYGPGVRRHGHPLPVLRLVHRLARGGLDGLGYLLERPLRQPAEGDVPADRGKPGPGRRCQLLGRRPGEDDQPSKPRRWHELDGSSGQGGRPLPDGLAMVHRAHGRDGDHSPPPGLRTHLDGARRLIAARRAGLCRSSPRFCGVVPVMVTGQSARART
jgi:hypothetical protein